MIKERSEGVESVPKMLPLKVYDACVYVRCYFMCVCVCVTGMYCSQGLPCLCVCVHYYFVCVCLYVAQMYCACVHYYFMCVRSDVLQGAAPPD